MRELRIYTQISVRVDSTSTIGLYIEEAEEFVVILQKNPTEICVKNTASSANHA